jgi:Na+/proline symporter
MAGLFAASISSFASVINALASTTLSDFYKPLLQALGRTPSERHQMRLSRGLAIFWAAALLVVALGFQGSSDNVLSVALSVLTYFYGAILGAFLLGAFTRRGRALTVVPGMLLGVTVVLLLQMRQFLELPARAPDSVRAVLAGLPEGLLEAVRIHVPIVAWPYWILLGTGITFLVGVMGSRGLTVSWRATSRTQAPSR